MVKPLIYEVQSAIGGKKMTMSSDAVVNSDAVEIYQVTKPVKMQGLRASSTIKKYDFLGMYNGDIISVDEHIRRKNKIIKNTKGELNGSEYAVDFEVGVSQNEESRLIFPVDMNGKIALKYKNVKALYANEPTTKQQPNAILICNYDAMQMQLMAIKDIRKNQAILWCYGGEYKPGYINGCKLGQIPHMYKYMGRVVEMFAKNKKKPKVVYVYDQELADISAVTYTKVNKEYQEMGSRLARKSKTLK